MTKISTFPAKTKRDESHPSDPKPMFQKSKTYNTLKHCTLQTIEKYFGHGCGY